MTHAALPAGEGNPLLGLARQAENASSLDGLVAGLAPLAERLVAQPRLRDLLHGRWLGHALHPLLTDLPLGFWMSGTVLDLLGDRAGAGRLIGLGVAAALPTAVTGAAEWASVTDQRDRRTGAVHALLNSLALACYAGAWGAHRGGRRGVGTVLAVAGGTAATAGGYLGGHLSVARKVGTRHPAFDG